MINRLWQDRRALQTLVVATGKRPGRMALSLLTLLRGLKRTLCRGRAADARQNEERRMKNEE
jgi:hypothetical protein